MVDFIKVSCKRCDGCGYVASDKYATPWVYYQRPLMDGDGSYISPVAIKLKCVRCGGTGYHTEKPIRRGTMHGR